MTWAEVCPPDTAATWRAIAPPAADNHRLGERRTPGQEAPLPRARRLPCQERAAPLTLSVGELAISSG